MTTTQIIEKLEDTMVEATGELNEDVDELLTAVSDKMEQPKKEVDQIIELLEDSKTMDDIEYVIRMLKIARRKMR